MYILDTDIFIASARRYYAFRLAPGFWKALLDLAVQGKIQSIDRVLQELQNGDVDDVLQWAETNFSFSSTEDEEVVDAYQDIIQWSTGNLQYTDDAKNQLAKKETADGWLVAYVKVHGGTVATNEKANPEVKKRIPIPNICEEFGVPFVDQFEMMRRLGIKLR